MSSLRVKEVAAAADQRIAAIEARLGGDAAVEGGLAGAAQLKKVETRVGTLEEALLHEQQASLKALEAMVAHAAFTP